jgi:glycolate dehydrogenase FAD-linked subunit
MRLPKDVYAELEGIVGPEYISDREYILAAMRHAMPSSPVKPPSPAAVLLPGNAEEIQQIVKVCNRHGLKFIPTVSSLIGFAYPTGPNTIILQLKRMNRITEINRADRYAVIESGVRHGQLKTELMKYGLSYPVAAVGPGGSVLVNFASSSGDNHNQHGASRTNRYILGVEWVLPSGELIRLGSLANDAGWFCADGPGPSLRGLIKGYAGPFGGFGVITRIAIGLDEWRGPAEMPTERRSPDYQIRLPKDRHKVFIFKFPTLDQLRDAMIEIGKAEIGQAVLKYFNATAALLATQSANHFWDLWDSGLFQRELARPLYVYLATHSAEEMAYEEAVLREIIAETGGEDVDPAIRAIYENNMDFFILVGFLQRVLRLGGAWAPTKLSADSIHHMFEVGKTIPEFLTDFIDKGLIFDAPDNFQIISMEYGHLAHIELLFLWERNQPDWGDIPIQVMARSHETEIRHGHHATMPPRSMPMLEKLGPLYSNCHVWSTKIAEAFGARK